jgi:hypothetical protein
MLNWAKYLYTTSLFITESAKNPQCVALCLQDPDLLPDGSPPSDPSFNRHYPSRKPKCVTYIRKSPQIDTSINYNYDDAVIGCKIKIQGNPSFTLYNVYSKGEHDRFFAQVTKNLSPTPSCIILGDFNCHHSWWYGDYNTATHHQKTVRVSPNANQIVDWLEWRNFQLVNAPGTPTHYPSNGNRPSIIDLTFARGRIAENVSNRRVLDASTSDHSLITFDVTFANKIYARPNIPTEVNFWKRANWDVFKKHIRDCPMDFNA